MRDWLSDRNSEHVTGLLDLGDLWKCEHSDALKFRPVETWISSHNEYRQKVAAAEESAQRYRCSAVRRMPHRVELPI